MNNKQQEIGPSGRANNGWWSREHVLTLVLFLATALAFYLCYLLARPFLAPLAWALALAIIAHPIHCRITARIEHPNLAATLAVVLVALTIVTPTIFVVQRLVEEGTTAIEAVQKGFQGGGWRKAIDSNPRFASLWRWAEEHSQFEQSIQGLLANATNRASTFLTGSAWTLVQLLVTFFILFYFFRDSRPALKSVRSLMPLSSRETDDLFVRVTDTIQATIYGTLMVAAVQGTLGGLMFWWLGLPAPLVWGVVMGLLAIVPVLGAFVVWIPASLVLMAQGSFGKAVILVLWGMVVIGLIDNLLYPVLVGKKLRLHTLPVFIAIVGGLFLFGAAGLILGPVILAVTMALVDVWRRRTEGDQTADSVANH